MDFELTTPVAFIIFNRPDVTFKVFERIRRAQPQKLFIIADGPRADRVGEAEKCEQCRTVKDMVDWDCEVNLNFARENLGCKERVYSGISWVFENVDEAIILEDDCLPDNSFFRFCQELLEKYRNDTRIMSIAGSNHDYCESFTESYNFASRMRCWGWATWKRAWNLMDVDMTLWKECRRGDYLRRILSLKEYVELSNAFQSTYEGTTDSWAYRFALSCYLNHGLCIIPKVNMVRNIGFRADAAHTKDAFSKEAFYLDEETKFPLVHPRIILPRENLNETFAPKPSSEELMQEISERNSTFKTLINAGNYDEVINYFKDTLKNSKSFHVAYIYYTAFAYLMKGDYNHAVALVEDLFNLNADIDLESFMIFVQVLFDRRRFEEGFIILDKILDKVANIDETFRSELVKAVREGAESFSPEKYPQIARFITPHTNNKNSTNFY